jgi:tetratricopeptide (TPR) repeat protein
MGAVYVAYDTQLERKVAIKVLRHDARDSGAQARLLREAQALARLAHRNVVAVHDVGAFGDEVFVAMEYVEGPTLKVWLNSKRSWQESLDVLKEAGRGLAAAHDAGLVHRDFKPENVLIGVDGRVVVVDFGIARASGDLADGARPSLDAGWAASVAASVPPSATEGSPSGAASGPSVAPAGSLEVPLTHTGALLGTVGYMAPERAFEGHDDAKSDQFGFCVTLHRALYGEPPFPSGSLQTYLDALLRDPAPPPAGTRVPPAFQAVIRRGLSRDPVDRFASMTELLAALDRDPIRRRRRWLAGAGVGAALAAGLLGWTMHHRNLIAECHAGESLIAETWNPVVRATVTTAIVGTGVPLASESAAHAGDLLDAYARDWSNVHRQASEATLLRGEQTVSTLNARLDCLDAERDELGSLVSILARADESVAKHALFAIYDLPPARTCLDPKRAQAVIVASREPELRARQMEVQHASDEVGALRLSGKIREALALATRTLPLARAVPDAHAEAALLSAIADINGQLGERATARTTWEEVFAVAEREGDESLAAIAAAHTAFELADALSDLHEAERWATIGRGILAHEGDDPRAEAELLEAETAIESSGGHPDQALAKRDRLIELLIRVYGPSHPRVANAINNRANDLSSLGQHERAIAEYRRSTAMKESLFGADAVALYFDYNNLACVLTYLGRYDEAHAAIQQAMRLLAPLGPDNANLIVPLATQAVLDNRVGDSDTALAAVDRALKITQGGAGERYVPCLLVQRGEALLRKKEPAGAREACSQALALQEKQERVGPDQTYEDDAITCLGEAEVALGHEDEGVAQLERSVTLTKRDPPSDLPVAQFALARALTRRAPERARELAQTAKKEFAATPGMEREAREADEWLATSGRTAAR